MTVPWSAKFDHAPIGMRRLPRTLSTRSTSTSGSIVSLTPLGSISGLPLPVGTMIPWSARCASIERFCVTPTSVV
jgi:hypothetical protein